LRKPLDAKSARSYCRYVIPGPAPDSPSGQAGVAVVTRMNERITAAPSGQSVRRQRARPASSWRRELAILAPVCAPACRCALPIRLDRTASIPHCSTMRPLVVPSPRLGYRWQRLRAARLTQPIQRAELDSGVCWLDRQRLVPSPEERVSRRRDPPRERCNDRHGPRGQAALSAAPTSDPDGRGHG